MTDRPTSPRWRSLLAATTLLVGGAACSASGSEGDRPQVVVTHSLLGDVVEEVVGDEATVEVLMPAGADPHDFEPSAAEIALLHEADLVVTNGLGFEVGLLDALDAAEGDGVNIVELGADLDPLPLTDHHDEHVAEQGEPDEDQEDPHWFTDPSRMARAVGLIAPAVEDLEGVDARTVAERAAAYTAELEAADADIEAALGVIPVSDRRLVTNHEVFGYFADRYGFEVVGTVIPGGTTLAEPSSGELTDLLDAIEETGVPAIFADTSSPTELADMLAAETGRDIEVVELYSESLGPDGSDGSTYLDLIQADADRIIAALT